MVELAIRNEQMRRENERLSQERKVLDRKAKLLDLHNRLLVCKRNYTLAHNCLLKTYAGIITLQTELLKDHCRIVQVQEILLQYRKEIAEKTNDNS